MALGLSVSRAAKAAGIDRITWTAFENGTRETAEYNYGPIERVLGWAAGSIGAILAGDEPTPMAEDPDQASAGRDGGNDDALDRLRMISQLVRSADLDPATKIRLIGALLADEPAVR